MADFNRRTKFHEKLERRLLSKKPNSCIFSNSEYNDLIDRVDGINANGCKDRSDYRKKTRFEVRSYGAARKLVKCGTDQIFLPSGELYDEIHTAHVHHGHAGRDVLVRELKKRFANVTEDVIMDYLSLCEECERKRAKTAKRVVTKPIISNDLNSRCQVDLIDMQSQPDGEFRFILVYQDHLTKFVQLRPLMTKRAEEVAHNLVQIFSIFGAPHILHTDNGREFENRLIKEVLSRWTGCKLVHGKPRHSQSQGSVERANRDVEDKLKCWMNDNGTAKWAEGLPFVQFAKNRCFHSGIGRSPYKAMFGVEPRVGLSTANLPQEAISGIETEEDLENAFSGSSVAGEERQQDNCNNNDRESSTCVEEANHHHQEEGGYANNENDSDNDEFSSDPLFSNCVVCQKPCNRAHCCDICKLPCHAVCGIPSPGDDNEFSEGYGSTVTEGYVSTVSEGYGSTVSEGYGSTMEYIMQ